MNNIKLIELISHGDNRGSLIALEKEHNVPFDIKRVYYIWGSKRDVIRGQHSHKSLEQLIVCISGSCDFILKFDEKQALFEVVE